jgi:hypothetical protein
MVYDNVMKERVKKIFEDKKLNEVEITPELKNKEEMQATHTTLKSIPILMGELDELVKTSGVDLEGEPLSQEELKKYGEEVFKTLNEKNPVIQTVNKTADEVSKNTGTNKIVDKVMDKVS